MTMHNSNIKNRYTKTAISEKIKKDLVIVKIGIEENLKIADYHDSPD